MGHTQTPSRPAAKDQALWRLGSSLADRRCVRAMPAKAGELLLRARLRARCRAQAPRRPTTGDDPWDTAAARAIARPYLDGRMASVKRRAHLDLIDRWLPDLKTAIILKTDLWEEGVVGDELLFTLARRARAAYGMDISSQVLLSASRAAARAGVTPRLVRGDLRHLPFEDGTIDAVVSTSTLDHLPDHDRLTAVREMHRVLRPNGVLVLTCDNAANLGDPLLRLAARLRLVPFPLERALSLGELNRLLHRAEFESWGNTYLVHGPRVLTTLLARGLRLLPGSSGASAIDRMLVAFEALGRYMPRRWGAFVAVRAVPRMREGAAGTA